MSFSLSDSPATSIHYSTRKKGTKVQKLHRRIMCISATQSTLFHQIHTSKIRRRLKRSNLQVLRLIRLLFYETPFRVLMFLEVFCWKWWGFFCFSRRRCEEKLGKDIELKNLQLYLENQTIIEENEKLREKANILHQENLALMTEFQKRFPCLDQREWWESSDGDLVLSLWVRSYEWFLNVLNSLFNINVQFMRSWYNLMKTRG